LNILENTGEEKIVVIDVAAAIIWKDDKFLACRRPAGKARGLLWEFVGGKVEDGETPEEALIRECREELAITVETGDMFMQLVHQYPDMTIRLTVYHAVITAGQPVLLEHCEMRWMTPDETDQYAFCPADADILTKLKSESCHLYIRRRLFELQDEGYRELNRQLLPTADPDLMIGVRVPQLRSLAAEIVKRSDCRGFLTLLPHRYIEENNLHGFIISAMKDYAETVSALDAFLPYVDNWATCDLISPRAFKKHPSGLTADIWRWMHSSHTYTIRFGMKMLMSFFLDEAFQTEFLDWVCDVASDEYYVKMMQAWFFATALAKQYDSALPYLKTYRLAAWTHNKAIQKATESYRISAEQKVYLKTLRISSKKI